MTAGTPSYMAPEQAMGLMPIDNRVDIYSLAAVTYAMLTSRPPFLVRSIADIVARDPLLAPEPIASRLGAPSTLDRLLLSGLATTGTAARRPPCCWRKAWKPSGSRCSQALPRDRVRRAA